MIRVKRVYDPPAQSDGARFLVDRLWPRGVKKESLRLNGWPKEAAPGDDLRRWFNHEAEKWAEFQRRYHAELKAHPEAWQPILAAARRGSVTLLHAARDAEYNNAVALKAYLERQLAAEGKTIAARIAPHRGLAPGPLSMRQRQAAAGKLTSWAISACPTSR